MKTGTAKAEKVQAGCPDLGGTVYIQVSTTGIVKVHFIFLRKMSSYIYLHVYEKLLPLTKFGAWGVGGASQLGM